MIKLGKMATVFVLLLLTASFSYAQKLSDRIDYFFVGGLNFGATAPLPFPHSHLDIKSATLRLNPQLGVNVIYQFDEHWGIGTGLTIDWKDMKVRSKVHNVYSYITVPTEVGGIPAGTQLHGHIEGYARTTTNMIYLTQPLYGTYRFNDTWQVRLGGYLAEALKHKFKGSVENVKIVADKINGNTIPEGALEKDIPYATYDFSKHVRKVEVGLLAGGEYRLNKHVGFYANFTWALNPYFSGENPLGFTTRNVYGNIGVTYRIK